MIAPGGALTQIENTGNGKLLYMGSCCFPQKYYIGRLDSTGQKDLTFGKSGIAEITTLDGVNGPIMVVHPKLVKTTEDQSLMIISGFGSKEMKLHKFDKDGNYDNSFGTNGTKKVPLPKDLHSLRKALYLPNGKILVLLTANHNFSFTDADIFVVRLHPDGDIDTTFGNKGTVRIDQYQTTCIGQFCVITTEDRASDMIYTSDGKIVLSAMHTWGSGSEATSVFRLNNNGTLDATFGKNGQMDISTNSTEVNTVSIHEQENRKYLLSFNQWNIMTGERKRNIVRFTYEGRLDQTFLPTDMPAISPNVYYGILGTTVQNDKKVVVLCGSGDKATPYLVRVKRNGGLDSTFGNNGIFAIDTLNAEGFWANIEDIRSHISQDINAHVNLGAFSRNRTDKSNLFTRLLTNDSPLIPTSSSFVDAGVDQTICSGKIVTIGTALIDGNTYDWSSNPSGFTSNLANPSVSPTVSTTYFLTVTSYQGEIAKDTVVITVNASPVADAGPDKRLCSTSIPVTIGTPAVDGLTYQWSPSIGLNDPTSATPKANRYTYISYVLTVTNAAGCSDTDTVVVQPYNASVAPSIQPSGSVIFCEGFSYNLVSSSSSGNQWFKDGVAIPGATQNFYTVDTTGDFSVRIDYGGCVSPFSNVIKAVMRPATVVPSITFSGSTTICSSQNITLSSSEQSGNQWYRNDSLISGANGQTYVASQAGSYYVIAKVAGTRCITDTSNVVRLTSNAPAIPTITQTGNTLISSAAADNQWYLNSNLINGATNQQYTPKISGSYTVKVTADSCSALSAPFEFKAPDTPTPPVDSLPAWSSNITIYPNPVSDVLKVNNPDLLKIDVRLVNSSGTIAYRKTTSDAVLNIDMQGISPGLYWLIIANVQTGETYNKLILRF